MLQQFGQAGFCITIKLYLQIIANTMIIPTNLIFREREKMFKHLLKLAFISMVGLNAMEDLQAEFRGIVHNEGRTFPIKGAADEAIARGAGDPRNPFVYNICMMFFTTPERGLIKRTVTRVANDVFLVPKHTAKEYERSIKYFIKEHPEQRGFFAGGIKSGKNYLIKPLACTTLYNEDDDIALMNLKFEEGALPNCVFLPIASPLENGDGGNAFVCAYSDVSIMNEKKPYKSEERTLSIHAIKKK